MSSDSSSSSSSSSVSGGRGSYGYDTYTEDYNSYVDSTGGSATGLSSYSSDSSSSYTPPAPTTYTASDGTVFTTAADRDAYNSDLVAVSEFEAAIAADETLKSAYDAGATNVFSGSSGEVTYFQQDPNTGNVTIVSSPTAEQIAQATGIQELSDAGYQLEKITLEDMSPGFWDNVTSFFSDPDVTVNAVDVDSAINDFVAQDYLQRTGYDVSQYDTAQVGDLWDQFTADKTQQYSFDQFIQGYNYLQENASSLLGDPEFMVRDGMLFASDPISAEGFIANITDLFVNSTVGYLGGLVAGDLLFAATGNPMAALTGAEVTNQAVKSIGILDQQVFLGADGRQYMQTSSAFGEPTFLAIEDAVTRATDAELQSERQISSGYFDGSSSLAAGIGSATTEGAITSTKSEPSWKDYYSFSLDPGQVIKETLTGVSLNPELYKAAQLATRLDAGEDLASAAVGVYGSDLVNFLPEDFQNPTEAAIRIAAGEDRVGVLGDIYGADLGLDNPLGVAGIDAASVYDQTGDGDAALKSGLITYFKEGGTLPEFEAPEFLDNVAGDIDFNFDFLADINLDLGLSLPEWVSNIQVPTGIFDGINFGDIKAQFGSIDLPSLPDLGIDLGNIDFSGLSFPEISADLNMGLPELADFDIDFSGVDFEGVDFMDLDVGVGELADMGIDWKDLNLGDISLPKLVLIAADKAEEEQTEEEKLALEIAMPDIVDPRGVNIADTPKIAKPFDNPLLG